jgi:hypothetical protein
MIRTRNRGWWESGAQNPARVRCLDPTDDSVERIRALRAQNEAFCRAMAAAGYAPGTVTAPGTQNPQPLRPPVVPVVRSSSGW